MQIVGTLISVGVTLAVAVAVGVLGVTTLLGAVRGMTERSANRPVMRLFMLVVSAGLGVMVLGMLGAVAGMLGLG